MSQSLPLRHHLQPPPTKEGQFRVSVSQIIRCEGVDWKAMIVSQSKQSTDLKTMDGGGHGSNDDRWRQSRILYRWM
ncbi:hypothetical protein Tco_1167813 [Tanacetum coccineum]